MGHELFPHNKYCASDDWLIIIIIIIIIIIGSGWVQVAKVVTSQS